MKILSLFLFLTFLNANEFVYKENVLFSSFNEPFIIIMAVLLGFLNTQYLVWFFSFVLCLSYSLYDATISVDKYAYEDIMTVVIRFATMILIYYLVNILKRLIYDRHFGDMSKIDEE